MSALSSPDCPLVLVVDNDAELRTYICEGLAALPVQTAEARDGLEALDKLRSHEGEVALVITDLFMERMDGRALKAALREDPRWANVPVLIITGERTSARDSPVLRKPFNAQRLTASVLNLLNR